jgi:hypothetical protein
MCSGPPRGAVLVRQVLGAIAQFDKATTVAKLKAARDRKIAAGEKCGVRKNYAEARPDMVELARHLSRPDPERRPLSLRKVAAALAERGLCGVNRQAVRDSGWGVDGRRVDVGRLSPKCCGCPRGRNRYRHDCRIAGYCGWIE